MVCLPWVAPKKDLSLGATGYKAAEGYDSFAVLSLSSLACSPLPILGLTSYDQ